MELHTWQKQMKARCENDLRTLQHKLRGANRHFYGLQKALKRTQRQADNYIFVQGVLHIKNEQDQLVEASAKQNTHRGLLKKTRALSHQLEKASFQKRRLENQINLVRRSLQSPNPHRKG